VGTESGAAREPLKKPPPRPALEIQPGLVAQKSIFFRQQGVERGVITASKSPCPTSPIMGSLGRMKKAKVRKGYQLYYAGKLQDADPSEIFFNSTYNLSHAEKFIQTWKLTETLIKLQNRNPDELRLDRTTLILKRIPR
jgi:hypothetical protein